MVDYQWKILCKVLLVLIKAICYRRANHDIEIVEAREILERQIGKSKP